MAGGGGGGGGAGALLWQQGYAYQSSDKYYHEVATILSVLSSCNKPVKTRLVATCHLQTFCNSLKQLLASLLITRFDNQLATNLLTTCNRLVVNKLSQAMRTRPYIGLLIRSLLQDVNRLVATCALFGYQFMFRARMCRSLIFDRVGDWDQRTVHSCAKHKLITPAFCYVHHVASIFEASCPQLRRISI